MVYAKGEFIILRKSNVTVTGHMIVKNEERWIWYSIMSVIDFVDELIIFDTGSTDNTVRIIKDIKSKYEKKIVFEEKGSVSPYEFYILRQEQIERTKSLWFFVVDGDEIWYKKDLEKARYFLENDKECKLLSVKFINYAGDIYHYRDFNRETYYIDGIKGSITIRFYSMAITGIKCVGKYGVEGYYDIENKPVQTGNWKIKNIDGSYLHMSLLQRSGKLKGDLDIKYRWKKYKADWDHRFPANFKYPEVFYFKRPREIWNPWIQHIGLFDYIFCFFRKLRSKFRK